MRERDRILWPFKPRAAITSTILILILSLIVLAVLRTIYSWPSQESERTVLLGIFVLSLSPILLMFADILIERGAVVEYKGVKIDFSQVQKAAITGITIPANIGVTGQAIFDNSTNEILAALKQAISSKIVVIDLEEGQAWWETRLLVLLSGAVRHNQPQNFVFVATDGGVEDCFQGWGVASDLLSRLLNADPRYQMIYHSVLAVARQWELVAPQDPPLQPPPLGWMQPLAQPFTAFDDTGLPNNFFAEQLLASELGTQIEMGQSPRAISIVRLEELFRPVLFRTVIDDAWPSERQLSEFFTRDTSYMAITRNGQFKSLISRSAVLNAMVGALVQNK